MSIQQGDLYEVQHPIYMIFLSQLLAVPASVNFTTSPNYLTNKQYRDIPKGDIFRIMTVLNGIVEFEILPSSIIGSGAFSLTYDTPESELEFLLQNSFLKAYQSSSVHTGCIITKVRQVSVGDIFIINPKWYSTEFFLKTSAGTVEYPTDIPQMSEFHITQTLFDHQAFICEIFYNNKKIFDDVYLPEEYIEDEFIILKLEHTKNNIECVHDIYENIISPSLRFKVCRKCKKEVL